MNPGFHEHASGLLVPADIAREREVWTKDEWRLLERCTKMLKSHGVALQMQCENQSCQSQPMRGERLDDGGFRLRCVHADRLMTKAF